MIIRFLQENSLYVLLALAAVCTCVWLLLLRRRLRMAWPVAILLSLLHVAYGVACVKVFAIMEGGSAGAMSLFGAVFFMPLAYWLGAQVTKRDTAEVFDIFAPCMIFTLFCARINCLVSGCCLGRIIPGLEPWRWPTREAELVFYVVFLALVAPRVFREKTYGQVYPLYMFLYGVVRCVLECFRVSATNGIFHLSHVWAVLALIVGFVLYSEIKRRHTAHTARGRS